MILKTNRELNIWNEAIRSAAKELLQWSGPIPEDSIREYVAKGIIDHCSRKRLSTQKKKP